MLSNICLFLILLIVGGTRCQLNVTQQSTYNNFNETTTKTDEISSIPPLWCPSDYKLFTDEVSWYHWCRPSACLQVEARFNNSENENVTVSSYNDSHVRICPNQGFSFDKSSSCRRVRLHPNDFHLNLTDYVLYETQTNASHQLGSYYYFESSRDALVCRDQALKKDDIERVFLSCMPYQPKMEEYTVFPNKSLYMTLAKRLVRPEYYHVSGYAKNQTPIVSTVCLEFGRAFDECQGFADINKEDFRMLPDLNMFTSFGIELTIPLGEYLMLADQSQIMYCIEAGEARRTETRHLYASAFVISALFLFATLLIHLLYPSLNYHARALLCHIISMLVMYVTMAIQTLENYYPSDTARFILFGTTYVSALAAFFWLNVLAYELWNVFSSVRGAPGGFGPQREKKRLFLIKCCYAWGIPLVMCCLTIGLAHEPRTAKALDLTLATDGLVWFNTNYSKFYCFYLPIITILVLNALFFCLTVWNIKKASKGTQMINKKVSKQLLRVFVKLFVVMGIFWFAEVISWLFERKADEAVWYATDLINALQGVAVFMVYVFKKSTWKMLKKKIKGDKSGSKSSKSTNSTGDNNEKNRKISSISNTEITMTNIRSVDNN